MSSSICIENKERPPQADALVNSECSHSCSCSLCPCVCVYTFKNKGYQWIFLAPFNKSHSSFQALWGILSVHGFGNILGSLESWKVMYIICFGFLSVWNWLYHFMLFILPSLQKKCRKQMPNIWHLLPFETNQKKACEISFAFSNNISE